MPQLDRLGRKNHRRAPTCVRPAGPIPTYGALSSWSLCALPKEARRRLLSAFTLGPEAAEVEPLLKAIADHPYDLGVVYDSPDGFPRSP